MKKTNVTPTATFALALLKQEVACKPNNNVFISPLSVSVALGMTANGARGETLTGMTATLSIGADMAINNKGYAGLLEILKRNDMGVRLDVANAIFARLGVTFEQSFLDVNQEFFNANVQALDFDDPATLDVINAFVSQSTNKLINKFLKDPIAPNTVMFLVNCVYFKGEWTEKFDKVNTKDLPFAGVGDIPLMYSNKGAVHGRDWKNNSYEFVSLPFGKSKEVKMIVVLPNSDKSIEDVLSVLSEKTLTDCAAESSESTGHLWLPRIDIEYENSLKDSLSALGMENAFGSADFSGMMPAPAHLFIQDVKHKTVFKVDEEGAEAAAVTSVSIGLECVRIPFSFKVNRPFITFVIDSVSNAVLFAGVVTDPTKK